MLQKFLVLLTVSISFNFLSAQIPINGSCPSFDCCKEAINSSDVKLDGVWYLYGGVPFFFNENNKCVELNITSLPDRYFSIKKSYYDEITQQEASYTIFGNYSLDGFMDTQFSTYKFPMKYEIIKLTSNYFIAIACSECGFFSKEGAGLYVYIYTRQRSPLYTIVDPIFAKLEECKIPTDLIEQQIQSTCVKKIVGSGNGC